MRLCFPWLVGIILLFWPAHSSLAADEVRLVGLEGRAQPSITNLAVFGGREQELNLELETPKIQSGFLRGDLFQVAGYAMPLVKNIKLKDGLNFSDTPPYKLQVSVKFPEVERQAHMILALALFSQPGASPVHSQLLRFEVFPGSVTKELTDLLRSKADGSAQVVVFGPGQKLRHFFGGLHVPFEDGGAALPDRLDADRFYLGELATNEEQLSAQDRGAGARLALFANDDSLPPGIYADRSTTGVLINVSLPMLDNLTDDPLEQLTLIKIIGQLSTNSKAAN
jgi:hypothetical protein